MKFVEWKGDTFMSRYGTSLREQSLFHFIHKFFPDTINRYKIRYSGKTLELDIFIPSLKLVIEYDGKEEKLVFHQGGLHGYEYSSFGYLEKRLNDERLFPLIPINDG